VTVAVEQADRVVPLEVLPLEHGVGEDLQDALDEGLDELVVGGAAQAGAPVSEVHRVL
jgi:hypothetical protein